MAIRTTATVLIIMATTVGAAVTAGATGGDGMAVTATTGVDTTVGAEDTAGAAGTIIVKVILPLLLILVSWYFRNLNSSKYGMCLILGSNRLSC